MTKETMAFFLVALTASVHAQVFGIGNATQKPQRNSHLAPLGTNVTALLCAEGMRKNHVVFVNVADAMPNDAFREAVAYVKAQWWINVVATNTRQSVKEEAVRDIGAIKKRFGGKACFVVEIVRDKALPDIVAVPGGFAQVNVHKVDSDKPAADYLKKRQIQMVLKGLAYSCGVGSNVDEFCVMYYKSSLASLEYMDRASATYGPFAYVPLRDVLFACGGEEIFDYMEE